MIHFLISIFKCDFTLLFVPIYHASHILLRIAIILSLIKNVYASLLFLSQAPFLPSPMPGVWTAMLPLFRFSPAMGRKLPSITCPPHLSHSLPLSHCVCPSLGLTVSRQNNLVSSILIPVPESPFSNTRLITVNLELKSLNGFDIIKCPGFLAWPTISIISLPGMV